MIKKKIRLEAIDFTGVKGTKISAHDMLLSLQKMIVPKNLLAKKIVELPLKETLGWVVAKEIRAKLDFPLFDESLRDGFALCTREPDCGEEQTTFILVGETGAGDDLEKHLEKNETWKVMTGAKVPGNSMCVVPQEWCKKNKNENTITVDCRRLTGPSYIKRKAEQFQKGDLIMGVGEVISPASLVKIADAGWSKVAVYSRPQVCFCCSGKELVDVAAIPGSAQKISSNGYLLSALIEQCGCDGHDYGIVGDEAGYLHDFFSSSLQDGFDLVLTSGGTGGGAFDLVESAFVEAGGTLICNSLAVRPGKSLIVGRSGETLYVGLPGPSQSLHTVFLEMVAPILMALRGVKDNWPIPIEAVVHKDIAVKTRENLVIKEGVLFFDDGLCRVRRVDGNERSTCDILIAPGRDHISAGEKVEVHLRQPLWG